MHKIEIACFNAEAALIAQEFGGDRIELCAEMALGGTTPPVSQVQSLRPKIHIDFNVMIRPRGGDFVYNEIEFNQMKSDIVSMKELGVDGLVFGILHEDNSVNIDKNQELVALASPLPCTFHRAFDDVSNIEESLENVISCGFKTILTSGCEANVTEGIENLKKLVALANDRIVIMPGGGLRSTNIGSVLRETSATYFHSSAITDGGDTAVGTEVQALKKQV